MVDKVDKKKELIIKGTPKEVKEIINSLIKQNPGMTIEEYLDKMGRDRVELC